LQLSTRPRGRSVNRDEPRHLVRRRAPRARPRDRITHVVQRGHVVGARLDHVGKEECGQGARMDQERLEQRVPHDPVVPDLRVVLEARGRLVEHQELVREVFARVVQQLVVGHTVPPPGSLPADLGRPIASPRAGARTTTSAGTRAALTGDGIFGGVPSMAFPSTGPRMS
jgi:hypothetical protein